MNDREKEFIEVPGSVDYGTDIAKQRESARKWVALSLVALFAAEIFLPVFMVIFSPERVDLALKVLDVVVAPTVALLGAATGFYFGSLPKNRGDG